MHHTRFIDLAAHYRLPAMYPFDILWTPGDSCPMG
jgi:hypothetical protein